MSRMSRRVRLAAAVRAAATLGAVCVLGAWTPAASAGQPVDATAEIRARIQAYLAAWDAHDASALGALFTEDADFVMGNQPAGRGRQEIQDWWRTYFERQESERRLELDLDSLRFLAPDVAVLSVTTTTGGPDGRGGDLPARRFRGTWLWEHRSDGWLISAMRGLPLEADRVILNGSAEAAETLHPQLRGFVAAYEDALNAQDPEAVSAFFGDDAEIVVRNSPTVTGRAAVRGWWHAYFDEPRPYRAILIIDDIRMITPDVALLNITATGAAPQRNEDRPAPVRYARATWVLARKTGPWRIARLWVLPSEDDVILRDIRRSR